jgi:hypothetical protein
VTTRQLLLDVDERARARAEGLVLRRGYREQHYGLTRLEERELLRLKGALRAATDAATFVALVKGEPVPADRLERNVVSHQRRRHG